MKFRAARALKPSFYCDYQSRKNELATHPPHTLSDRFLAELLSFCRDDNPYYRSAAPTTNNLSHWPLLNKDDVRTKGDLLLSDTPQPGSYNNSSGGSTGQPLTIVQNAEYRRWTARTQEYYFREFHSIEWNQVRNVWLWGSDRDMSRMRSWRTRGGAFLRNRLMLNTFHTSDAVWLQYIDQINHYRPYFVAGYAGSLYQISKIAEEHNKRLYRPRFVYSSAELLQDFMRVKIEEQFRAEVFDYYGSREVGAIAGACRFRRLHVFVANNIVEVVDNSGSDKPPGEEGQIAVTNLHNRSMPLIRYLIGDTAVVATTPCQCGSTLPSLQRLTGRSTDHFRTRSGSYIHGEYFTHLFYHRDWIAKFQVDQLDYDHVRVSIVSSADAVDTEVADITRAIRSVMGCDCRVDWNHVSAIERTAEGKHLYTRCLL